MKLPRNSRKNGGFTLVELMVSTAIGLLVVSAVGVLVYSAAQSTAAVNNYLEMNDDIRRAYDYLSRDIRQADKVVTLNGTDLALRMPGGATLAYTYYADTKTLRRYDGTNSMPLVRNCVLCQFAGYEGGIATNNLTPTATTSLAAMQNVRVSLQCQTQAGPRARQTETLQSALIRLRN